MPSRLKATLLALTLAAGLSACKKSEPAGVLVIAPPDAAEITERTLQAAQGYLETLSGSAPVVVRLDPNDEGGVEAVARERRAGLVLVLEAERYAASGIDEARLTALGEDGFVLETRDVGDWENGLGDAGATLVTTAGNSTLADQYAVYEFLRRLGARFYHPEEEFVPTHEPSVLRQLARTPTLLHRGDSGDYTPDFTRRSWSFHGAHPLEHLEAFSDGDHPIDEAVHVNDWIVKNRGDRFKGAGRGVSSEESRARRVAELDALRVLLGFPTGSGITLHNQQQGASAVVDPSSEIPPKQQIETYVAERLAENTEGISFGIHFGPTEVTVTPDQETVDWINWAGQAALALRPDIAVEVNNHISGGQATPNFDDLGCPPGTNDEGRGDYYDLAFHSDPRFGITVHTVMFYPLEGPARVYNQQTFAHKLCLMEKASAAGRPLTYFPEGSWWLSFDNPVPVYLPLYIGARVRDIELVRPLLATRGGGTLEGHHMFNSGQEWGYWQQDYAVGLLAWNADLSLTSVLGELLDPLCAPSAWQQCAARDKAIAVMTALIEHQRSMFLERSDFRGRPGGLYLYFAGEDPADELAALAGFEFRPVPVGLDEVAGGFDQATIDQFRATDLAALAEAAALHEGWLAELTALRDEVPPLGRPWLDEIVDGVEINLLRARHARSLYAVAAGLREAALAGGDPLTATQADWDAAEQALAAAEQVVRRREEGYRYPPAQTHGGGLTPETAVDNGTTYGFRVHTKTHLLTYWHNRHQEVHALRTGEAPLDADAVALTPALAAPETPLAITWPSGADVSGQLMVGALSAAPPTAELDLTGESYWPVTGELTVDGASVALVGGVARASIRAGSDAGALTLVEPDSTLAQQVLQTIFPAIDWGLLPDGVVMAVDADDDGVAPYTALVHADATVEGAAFTSAAFDTKLPIALDGAERTLAMQGVVLAGTIAGDQLTSPVTMSGQLVLADLVDALIELAGFDEAGALMTLSGILGFDPAAPPEAVAFTAEIAITPG
ncbi:MAG: hypothetical protein R3A51_01760 [Nannocystaceae bacterium]